jgi:hypothetical protein
MLRFSPQFEQSVNEFLKISNRFTLNFVRQTGKHRLNWGFNAKEFNSVADLKAFVEEQVMRIQMTRKEYLACAIWGIDNLGQAVILTDADFLIFG